MTRSAALCGYVIEHGRIELEGSAAGLLADSRVRKAYLGEAAVSSPSVAPTLAG